MEKTELEEIIDDISNSQKIKKINDTSTIST